MFRLLRRMRRDERGQAIVLGAVSMLILALIVMSSVTIGHGVYSKIKLQDAADSQSYSIAVTQARAYNFLAYTNRAMVVHYSAMLTVMSYVSHALYLKGVIGGAAKYLKLIPGIGSIFASVDTIIKAWVTLVETVSRLVIPILSYINVGLWLAQEALLYSTFRDIYTDMFAVGEDLKEPYHQTDPLATPGFTMGKKSGPNADTQDGPWDMNWDNSHNFFNVVDDGPSSIAADIDYTDPSGMLKRRKLLSANSLSDPDMAKYRLLMGNLANGVRQEWTAQGKGPLLIGRRWKLNLCVGVGIDINKVADSQIKSFAGNTKDQLFASDDITLKVKAPCLGPLSVTVFEFDYRVRATADDQKGFHQIRGTGSSGTKTDQHHPWMGITPFLTADPSYYSPWRYHFGYPCNMVFLSKDMSDKSEFGKDLNASAPVLRLKVNHFMDTPRQLEMEGNQQLDMTWDELGDQSFADRSHGMVAASVGRAIYHRPGDWKEEPNFFNPLWTARLAPLNTHWQQEAMKEQVPELANAAKMLNY